MIATPPSPDFRFDSPPLLSSSSAASSSSSTAHIALLSTPDYNPASPSSCSSSSFSSALSPSSSSLPSSLASSNPTSPLLSPSLLSHCTSSVWHCPFDCGQRYKRSSGRSIRRHVNVCFRLHNPATSSLSDEQLSHVINQQQTTGQLTTGLRRWKMRQPRRLAGELCDDDRWDCVWNCGKSYRATSSRSIQRHANSCYMRSDGQTGDVDVRGLRGRCREQRKKRRTYERFDTAADHSSDAGGEDSERSSASSTPSSHKQSHQSLAVTSHVESDDSDMRAANDELLAASWNTTCLDGPLEDAMSASSSSFTQLSPLSPLSHSLRQRQHQYQQQQSQMRPTGQLPSLGSLERGSSTFSFSSTWPPLAPHSISTDPTTVCASISSSSSSFSSNSTSLLSSPPQLSWLSSASSASVDNKTIHPSHTEQPVSTLPLPLTATSSVSVSAGVPPSSSPLHQPQEPFHALSPYITRPHPAPPASAATSDVGGGGSTAQSLSLLPYKSSPSHLSCPASSTASRSLSASSSVFQSSGGQHHSLYEREQQVSDELCSLLTSLYGRYGLQHPVFQHSLVSPHILQRALQIKHNHTPSHVNTSSDNRLNCRAAGGSSSHLTAPPCSSSSSVNDWSSALVAATGSSNEWQSGLTGLLSQLLPSSPCTVAAAPPAAFSSW